MHITLQMIVIIYYQIAIIIIIIITNVTIIAINKLKNNDDYKIREIQQCK